MTVRDDLASRLAGAADADVTVWPHEPGQTSLPALVIRPGAPYRGPGIVPGCIERWRLEVVAIVPVDMALPLDALDALTDFVRDTVEPDEYTHYNGVRTAPAIVTIAGQSVRAAVIELDIDV